MPVKLYECELNLTNTSASRRIDVSINAIENIVGASNVFQIKLVKINGRSPFSLYISQHKFKRPETAFKSKAS